MTGTVSHERIVQNPDELAFLLDTHAASSSAYGQLLKLAEPVKKSNGPGS